jgi:hypothetical protein
MLLVAAAARWALKQLNKLAAAYLRSPYQPHAGVLATGIWASIAKYFCFVFSQWS